VQAVLYTVTAALARLVAPFLCFTAEDVWRHLPVRHGKPESVHLCDLPLGRKLEPEDDLAAVFARLLEYRELSTRALEPFRASGHRSTDAQVTIAPLAADRALLAARLDMLADLFIVSKVVLADADGAPDGVDIRVGEAPGTRCERCWRWFEQMATDELCRRCADAVAATRGG
jgi:isoleucyl-tRNA synthetase